MSSGSEEIEVVTFWEGVRRRPRMYFGMLQDDPGLPTAVLGCVLRDALHHGNSFDFEGHSAVRAELVGDLVFTVQDDRRPQPLDGEWGNIFDSRRWAPSAGVAVSSRAVVETWSGGRGRRREIGAALGPIESFEAPLGQGTRIRYELDRDYFGPGAAIAPELSRLGLHEPECSPDGPDAVLRDLRTDPPTELWLT